MGAILTKKDHERIAWVNSFDAGKRWFRKLRKEHGPRPGTEKVYALALERFTEATQKNPDEIIEAYKNDLHTMHVDEAVQKWNDIIDDFFLGFVDKGMKRSAAAGKFAAIKSFFNYNVSIELTAKTPEFYSERKKGVSIEDIQEKILPHTDVIQRFEVLFLKDSGISKDDALRLNVGDVENLGNGFGYIGMHRAKEHVDYETFIGPNAMEAMKQQIEYRERLGFEVTKDSPLFVKLKRPGERQTTGLISSSFQRLTKKAGIAISTHRLRKTFETFLAIGKVHPIVIKYWAGHKVVKSKSDIEARYIIPSKPDQMNAYMQAYRHLDVTPRLNETQVLLAEIRTRMEALPPQQRRKFATEMVTAYRSRAHTILSDEKIKELLKEKPKRTDGGLIDCGEEYQQIPEANVLEYLRQGYTLVHKLQSGEVIVKR